MAAQGGGWYGNNRADRDPDPEVEDLERVARDEIMFPLADGGYQLIEFKWIQNGGWLESKSNNGDPEDQSAWLGLKAASCRQKNLLEGLKEAWHPVPQPPIEPRPYCATGQSGGAVQLAYVLTYHAGDTFLDSVVFTSGPPFVDQVFGCKESGVCAGPESQTSQFGCWDSKQECLLDQTYGNDHPTCLNPLAGSIGPCQEPDGTVFEWEGFAEDDGLVPPTEDPEADYLFPFAVHFLFGQNDDGDAPPQAMKYRNRLYDNGMGTETSCWSIVGLEHGVPWGDIESDPNLDGPLAVLSRLQSYCLPRSEQPSTAGEEDINCTLHHTAIP